MENKFFQRTWFKVLIVSLLVILLVSNTITVYLLLDKMKRLTDLREVQKHSDEIKQAVDLNKEKDQEAKTDEIATSTKEEAEKQTEKVKLELVDDTRSDKITVDWYKLPEEVTSDIFFDRDIDKKIDPKLNPFDKFKYYFLGKINNGIFSGAKIGMIRLYWGMGDMLIERVIILPNEVIFLDKYSDGFQASESLEEYGIFTPMAKANDLSFYINKNILITNYDVPNTIKVPNSKLYLKLINDGVGQFFNEYDSEPNALKAMFEYEPGKYVYKNGMGCFVIKTEDSTIKSYYLDVPFLNKKEEGFSIFGDMTRSVDLTWSDGTKNVDDYSIKIYKCGGVGCYAYVDYVDMTKVKVAGRTSSGDKIFELSDINLKASPKDEKSVLKSMYDEYYPGWDEEMKQPKEKEPFETFLKSHPLLYWQDPFGDFIEFRKASFLPAVECGKPVIYLYPEEDMDVSVKVAPSGGFKITEPDYGDGWQVLAKVGGEIINQADGQTYPYLFWEGYGLNYQIPEKGFVVPRAELQYFLVDKLTKLGLVKNEYDEFIEFWLPRMQEKPYYFVTFVDKKEFDQLAPLDVNPKPDTIIRVFMDYKGLDEYKEVAEQTIITPQRKGFTVVEWGGAIRR